MQGLHPFEGNIHSIFMLRSSFWRFLPLTRVSSGANDFLSSASTLSSLWDSSTYHSVLIQGALISFLVQCPYEFIEEISQSLK